MNTPLENLRVSLVQTALIWQKPEENRVQLAALMAPLAGATDVIVLPEMFTTGFMMEPETHAETEQGKTLPWVKQQASQLGSVVCGSVAIQTHQGFVNRFYWVTPQGEVSYYDKRHLFRMGKEHEHYQSGNQRVVIQYRGWNILPIICYDLRFPVFMRNQNDYDLSICVANWPAPRRNPWRTLLQARAIENQCYMLGVNRVGQDAAGLHYSGDSLAVDYKGDLLIDQPQNASFVETTALSLKSLRAFRENFPAWQDADIFRLEL